MPDNNISFTSRINFVNSKMFDKFRHGSYIDIRKSNNLSENLQFGISNSDEFYTDEVRTCTAGAIINSKTKQCVGFHIYDCLNNEEKIDDIINYILSFVEKPDKALLLGSKKIKCSNYSLPIFDKIYEKLASNIKNITTFKEHTFPFSESNLHYNAKNDIWTIHSLYRERINIKDNDVLSQNDIKKAFKEIKLADGDSIYTENAPELK